jgi:hypothetical protein
MISGKAAKWRIGYSRDSDFVKRRIEVEAIHGTRCGSKVSPGPPETAPDASIVTIFGDVYSDTSGFSVVDRP